MENIEQPIVDYIPNNQEVDEYIRLLKEEIDRLINEMYIKTLIPKYQPYEIDYSIKDLNFRKENPIKYFTNDYNYVGINIIDPNKLYILPIYDDIDSLKDELIKNKLIKSTLKDRIRIKITKLWYELKFICFYYKNKIIKNK